MTEQYQLLPDLTAEEYDTLKADIKARGIQVPIEFDEHGNILDGHHRMRICSELGIKDYPSIIRAGMSEDEKKQHLLALNLMRRHLNREQRQELHAKLRAMGWSLRQIAETTNVNRMTVGRDLAGVTNVTPKEITGKDGKKYPAIMARNKKEAQRVFEAFENVTAEELPDRMLDVRAVERVERRQDRPTETPGIPDGKYNVIYADPPWQYSYGFDIHGAADRHYATLSIEELCNLPIANLAEDNAVLFLWVTSPKLFDAAEVIKAWGFEYKTSFVWDKVKHVMGHYNSVRHEFLLICTRGSYPKQSNTLHDSVITIEREDHSEKPDYFRELIDDMYPSAKKIELFARKRVDGWDSWGNEL